MVIINTKTDKAYEWLSQAEAARIIGVNVKTIWRWKKIGTKQIYNHFHLYFDTERKKQYKGGATKKRVIG